MTLSRRRFLSASAAGLAFGGLARLANAQTGPLTGPEAEAYGGEVYGYGPLIRDPAGLIDLPQGFSYQILSRAGDRMSDGLMAPGKMDGMGCLPLGGDRVALVRNHECKFFDSDLGPWGAGAVPPPGVDRALIYDFKDTGVPLVGGTTTLVYDLKTRRLDSQHLSLTGTSTNCAGGSTPWGSWLSCEESTETAGLEVGKDHGFVFEVPAAAKTLVQPVPLKALGRFRHEAVCIDPATGVAYLTEDESDGLGLFYRFLPNDRTALYKGGKLQALGIKGEPGADIRNWDGPYWKPGDRRDTIWIDLDGVDNPYGDLRFRGSAAGAAWMARGEGVFHGADGVYVSSTTGGLNKYGHIYRYRPSPLEGQAGEADQPGVLELFVETADRTLMEMNDNIALSPWGHLFVCEDKENGVNSMRAVTPQGRLYTIARNAQTGGGDVGLNSELAGVCFSPDGGTMFFNIYRPGMTVAVRGPWNRYRTRA